MIDIPDYSELPISFKKRVCVWEWGGKGRLCA